ncbi:MAG: DNA-processing protein DprA [Anaerolineae bacterium]|nr:DNA-processing protein DprA [Anaerolineae bacterium]MDW8173196.1 DNA-processing protein DprA [Anaerolineae bacterium]
MDEARYWLAFSLSPQVGSSRIQQLITYFGSLEAAWKATLTEWLEAGLPQSVAHDLRRHRDSLDMVAEWKKIMKAGAHIITLADDSYPTLLRKISNPPAVLYVRGELLQEDDLALAVVGTRRATHYGKDAARYLARELAANGVTIISGLAQGIDSAAHEGALEGQGRTVAIFGSGIDQVYPREHQPLAERIVQRGALVSELPIGTPPQALNFPRRNRIMSGMALGVLVVEAPAKSGALITVESALEQGRDVFAVPHSIFNAAGSGTNQLIQEGAKLVMGPQDILSELQISYQQNETERRTQEVVPESPLEAALLAELSSEPRHVDDLIRQLGLSSAEVLAALAILELKGLAQMTGHMQYCRANPL